eukprot:m.138019 g.138019  ORF g.138019 m.138019 type:complete len:257 (+) comp12980_c0_seq1:147-917(+)
MTVTMDEIMACERWASTRELLSTIFLFKDDAEGDQFMRDALLSMILLWVPIAIFFLLYKRDTAKRLVRGRAWFPTLIVAVISTYIGLPFALDILQNGFSLEEMYVDSDRARFGVTFYIVFAITDIVLGVIFYPGELDILSGWIHHIMYVLLQINLLRNHATSIFMPGFLEELPTAILALGHIHPMLRQDILFGLSFFLTRILFQYIYAYFIVSNYNHNHPSAIFCVAAASVSSVLHTHWFINWAKNIKKYLKKKPE